MTTQFALYLQQAITLIQTSFFETVAVPFAPSVGPVHRPIRKMDLARRAFETPYHFPEGPFYFIRRCRNHGFTDS
jgi:hypothetical protein